MNLILSHINTLARSIQQDNRTYYKARIIEFLTYLLSDSTSITISIRCLFDFLDDADKPFYIDLLTKADARYAEAIKSLN